MKANSVTCYSVSLPINKPCFGFQMHNNPEHRYIPEYPSRGFLTDSEKQLQITTFAFCRQNYTLQLLCNSYNISPSAAQAIADGSHRPTRHLEGHGCPHCYKQHITRGQSFGGFFLNSKQLWKEQIWSRQLRGEKRIKCSRLEVKNKKPKA